MRDDFDILEMLLLEESFVICDGDLHGTTEGGVLFFLSTPEYLIEMVLATRMTICT